MKEMIIYNGPVGETIENPSEEFIKNIFFHKDEVYWKLATKKIPMFVNWMDLYDIKFEHDFL